MIAFRLLMAGALTAGAVALAGEPVALADPLTPGQAQYLNEGDTDPPCRDDRCQQPPRVKKPPQRGVMGCVRGVCVPRRNR